MVLPDTPNDLVIKIALLAEAKGSIAEIQKLESQLNSLRVSASNTRATLDNLFDKGAISAETHARATKLVNNELGDLPSRANLAGKSLLSMDNIARTVFGTFTAMAVFLITQLVGNAIKKTIESVSQLEQSLIKLSIAEKSISAAGVDITPKQLSDIVSSVSNAYETVSKIDASKMVSNLAVLTKDLRLSADQYKELAMAIPLVAQQAGVTIDNATEQVINGLTKSGRGWADLGITVDAEIIKQRAVTDGIVSTRQAYDSLSAEQKQQVEVQALINILLDNTNSNLSEQKNYLNTIEGQTSSANAQWEDLLATLGRLIRPATIEFLKEVTESLKRMNNWLDSNQDKWAQWSANIAAVSSLVGNIIKNIGNPASFLNITKWVDEAKAAYNEALSLSNDLNRTGTDTPTGNSSSASQADDSLQKALEKMNNEILEAQIKLGQDMEEAAIDLGRKLEDITIEYEKKRADAYRDYSSKVADINRSYADKIASINESQAEATQSARNNELDREAKFQEEMRQLKERFLMSMDDALHARDARQVLRLISQYNLDREQAQREHDLETEKAQRDLAQRRAQFSRQRAEAARERAAKLAEAKRDYQDKLIQLKANEDAERAAAQLSYERKVQDLNREMQDRLELVAAGLVKEFNLTKEGLTAILNLYKGYYTQVAQMQAAMNTMLSGRIGSSTPVAPTRRGVSDPGGGRRAFAEGGSMVANRPTTVTFGEAGLEMATFTPIGRNGKDVNKVFSAISGNSGGSKERAIVELLLSPDLEGRIVNNSVNKTAEIIVNTMREV